MPYCVNCGSEVTGVQSVCLNCGVSTTKPTFDIVDRGGITLMVNKEGVVLAINPTIDYIKNTLKERI